ncbi:FecR domain-containing protein [Pseudomonas sp. X10]
MNDNPTTFSPRTTREAAQWLTRVMDGELTPAQEQALRQWRAADAENERAWQHIQNRRRRLAGLDPQAGYQSLKQVDVGRRRIVRNLLTLAVIGGGAPLAYRQWRADDTSLLSQGATAPRTFVLDDGSQLTLDAQSEVAVQFDTHQRTLHLRSGRLLLTTGKDQGRSHRPLQVATPQGRVLALGTRFSVELQASVSHVSLFDGMVELYPLNTDHPPLRLTPGQRGELREQSAESDRQPALEPAWSQGLLIADAMRLDAFIARLGRYRPGLLRCGKTVAGLHISGVYPVADTDKVLDALTHALPLRIVRRTRYWVTVEAR